LYPYLSKVANTAEKRHYLHVSCTVIDETPISFEEVASFLDVLYEFKVFDLDLSVFQPYDPCVLLVTMGSGSGLADYFRIFRSNPERSREFYYEDGLWNAFVATRYVRFLRTPSNSK